VAELLSLLVLYAADQLSKLAAIRCLAGTDGLRLLPGVFELQYVENRGAAFGMLEGRRWLFILFTLAVTAALAWYLRKTPAEHRSLRLRAGVVLVAAGAFGNLTDRILRGFVVDFLYVALIDFPVFNLADICICVGLALLLWDALIPAD